MSDNSVLNTDQGIYETKPAKGRKKGSAYDEIIDWLEARYVFRLNILKREEMALDVETQEDVVIDDYFIAKVAVNMSRDGFGKVKTEDINRCIRFSTFAYHPLKHYFGGLAETWDKTDHIRLLADSITVIDDKQEYEFEGNVKQIVAQDVWYIFLKKWLVASVATGINEVSYRKENQVCITLGGGQGKLKTTWCNKLLPPGLGYEYLHTGGITPQLEAQETSNIVSEKFICVLDDYLNDIQEREFEQLKNIITTAHIANRKAYAKTSPMRKSIVNFLATVNQVRFLRDIENRRYFIIEVENIDGEKMEAVNMTQVWAQAAAELQDGFQYWNTDEEKVIQRVMNNKYRFESLEEEILTTYFRPAKPEEYSLPYCKFHQYGEIVRMCQKQSEMKLIPSRFQNCMRKAGFEKMSKRVNGLPIKVYPCIEIEAHEREGRHIEIRNEYAVPQNQEIVSDIKKCKHCNVESMEHLWTENLCPKCGIIEVPF